MILGLDLSALPNLDNAACKAHPLADDIFYPGQGTSARAAKELCYSCPVQRACLEWALDNNEQDGIWGGLGINARKKILAERRAAAAQTAAA